MSSEYDFKYFTTKFCLPDMASDNSVSMPHPDALPDLLLDLVVVRVGGRQHLVQLQQVGRVHLLRLLQVVGIQLVVSGLHQVVHLGQALEPHEEVDGGAAPASQLGHVGARVEWS